MTDIRTQDFYKKALPEKKKDMLSFFLRTEELKANGSISKHFVDGVGTRPALKASCYIDFNIKFCVHNWNINEVGISVTEGHICNPVISDEYEFIYFLLNDDDLIYVGRTINLFTRIDTHASNKRFKSFKWILVEKQYVDFFEKFFIDLYRPIENRFIAKPKQPQDISNASWIILGGHI